MTYKDVYIMCARQSRLEDAQHRACARYLFDGKTNITAMSRECGISRPTALKLYRKYAEMRASANLEEAQPLPDSLAEQMPGPEPEPEIDSLTQAPIITGPRMLRMLDTQILSANNDGRIRDLKMLQDMKAGLVDQRAELPSTKVDIERTLGPEGLLGMDEVLKSTLKLFLEHRLDFPKSYDFLKEAIGTGAIDADSPETPTLPEPLGDDKIPTFDELLAEEQEAASNE